MNRAVAAIGLAFLAGCAAGPQERRESWVPYSHESKLPPYDAAACIGRALERELPGATAPWRPGETPGHWEIYMLDRTVEITPAGSGSSIRAFVQPFILSAIRDRTMAAVFSGC